MSNIQMPTVTVLVRILLNRQDAQELRCLTFENDWPVTMLPQRDG